MKVFDAKDYFQANMDILDKDCRDELFLRTRPIFTRIYDESPAYYGDQAEGQRLPRPPTAATSRARSQTPSCSATCSSRKDAEIKDSIIMENGRILTGASLAHMVLDRGVTIREGRTMMGHENYPVVVAKALGRLKKAPAAAGECPAARGWDQTFRTRSGCSISDTVCKAGASNKGKLPLLNSLERGYCYENYVCQLGGSPPLSRPAALATWPARCPRRWPGPGMTCASFCPLYSAIGQNFRDKMTHVKNAYVQLGWAQPVLRHLPL